MNRNAHASACRRAPEIVSKCLVRALPVRNFGDPGSFDYRGYLARQDIQLQGTLRNDQLLTVVDHPRLTISDRSGSRAWHASRLDRRSVRIAAR